MEKRKSELPDELIYADDCDFVTEDEKKKEEVNSIVSCILPEFNLLINQSKTEHTNVKRR